MEKKINLMYNQQCFTQIFISIILPEVASETFIIYYIIFIATGEPQTNYKNLEKVKDTSVYSLLLVVFSFFNFYILYLYFLFLRNVVLYSMCHQIYTN